MTRDPQLTVQQLIDYGARLVQEQQPDKARPFFAKVLERDPRNVEARLWLAGISDTAADSYRYITQALEIDPRNDRARAALRWARKREQAERMQQAAGDTTGSGERSSSVLLSAIVALFVLIGAAATIYLSQPGPVALAQVESPSAATNAAAAPSASNSAPPATVVAQVEATATPTLPPVATPTTEPTASPTPTLPPTEVPTATPLPTITPEPPTPEPPTPEPSVAPTAVPQAAVDTSNAANPGLGASGERWIDVDLSQQRLVAYEGDKPVYGVTVSTGLPGTPTVTGQYHIYVKYPAQTMSGPGYYLPNVPYVMYFYEGYGIHGTYWHNNFGHPMSHGCVNAPTPDAAWLYNWAEVGTLVNVHY